MLNKNKKNKSRINPEKIMIDKHKRKLTNVINNKIELVNRMCESLVHFMSWINNKINMIDKKIHKVCEMHNDTLHLINDKLKEIMTRSIKKIGLTLV